MKITARQLRALLTLFSLYARRSLLLANGEERAARLAWASQQVGHEVASFNELRSNEAARLIDTLKQELGQEVSPPVRKRLDREAAMARGVHGRKGRKVRVEMMTSPDALEEIERLRVRLGWTAEHFETWLGSRYSPLCGRAEPKLRTISDCNRVRWALQKMLRRAANDAATEERVAKVS
jgi:hypothetical protein